MSLFTQDHSSLASSLQAAFNLRVLPTLAHSLLADLTQSIEGGVRATFDVVSLSKETNAKGKVDSHLLLYHLLDAKSGQETGQSVQAYRSRVRTEPTNVTAAQWTNALWARLESLVEDMAGCCIKVNHFLVRLTSVISVV